MFSSSSHRDRHSEQARHIDERVRAAFGMPPVDQEPSAHELPPGAHQVIPGEVMRMRLDTALGEARRP